MHIAYKGDCTCHLCWIELPLPGFVLSVHHLFFFFLCWWLRVLLWDLVCGCEWKVFGPLPGATLPALYSPLPNTLSFNETVQVLCTCSWAKVCVVCICVHVEVRVPLQGFYNSFTLKKLVFTAGRVLRCLRSSGKPLEWSDLKKGRQFE